MKIVSTLLSLASLASCRDPSIGIDNFGSVKVPSYPIKFPFTAADQEKTYNILTTALFGGSPKKILDELSLELSKQKWPDSGKNMFNVTLMTSENN